MRIHSFIIAALFCSIQLYPTSAGELVVPSEPVVRGSIRSSLSYGQQCLSAQATEILPGARLEMRPCRNSVGQISIGMCSVSKLKFTIYASMLCDPGKINRSPTIRSVCGIVKGHNIRSGSQVATVRRRRNLALLAEVSPPTASVWIFLMAAMPMARSW